MAKGEIDKNNFDKKTSQLFNHKKQNGVIMGRFDLEKSTLVDRISFVYDFIKSSNNISDIIYKIKYWEPREKIEKLLELVGENTVFSFDIPYKNGQKSGVLFVSEQTLSETFFQNLILNHFNFEHAKDPSLNIKVQVCINRKDCSIIFDIYDDRGFNVYYLT